MGRKKLKNEMQRMNATFISLEERVHILENNQKDKSCMSHLTYLCMLLMVKPFTGMVKMFGAALVLDTMNCAIGMLASQSQAPTQPCLMLRNGLEVCPPPRMNGAHTMPEL
jgi:hypothetical protein